METYLIVCPLLFLAGLVDAIAGGGGLISLPAYLIAGLPAHMALGSNKFSGALGTTISTIRFARHGYIKARLAVLCILGATIGSSIGSRLALLLSEHIFKNLMLIILPIVAFYVLRSKSLSGEPSLVEPTPDKHALRIILLSSLLIGGYDGFYGPGTGTFLILIFTGWAKLGIRTSAGLTKAANLASNLAALATFILNGKVYFPLAIAGAVCNILGNYLGSGLVLSNAQKVIKPVIILVLLLLFAKIIFQG